ncbi:MAG: hypothetical protein B7X11_05170, partial [Acidobacteria bacterium 37-65-4]
MKKILVAVVLVLGTMGIFAQAGTQYVAIMPGYQFSTGSYTYNDGMFQTKAKGEGNFMFSVDYGYFFTENVGLHAAYLYDKGDYKANLYIPALNWSTGNYKFSRQVNLFEIGPEFATQAGTNGQFYGQLNLGYTFGSGDTKFYYNGHRYNLGNVGGNDWAFGGALGYRYYFNNSVGLGVQ